MVGHDVKCTVCGNNAEVYYDALDAPPPEDKLCRSCRRALVDASIQQAKSRKWRLFANQLPDGSLAHFFPSTMQVKMCGEEPIVLAELSIDDNGPYWGWLHSSHEDNRSDRGRISFIYKHVEAVRICFPYGPEAETKRGLGAIVRLRAEVLRPAKHPEGIIDDR